DAVLHVALIVPAPGIDDALGRIHLAVHARHLVLGAVGFAHVNAVPAPDAQVDFGERNRQRTRRMPALQLFRFRPRVEDALPRRADGAPDFEGRRRAVFFAEWGRGGHGDSGEGEEMSSATSSRYAASNASSDSQNAR